MQALLALETHNFQAHTGWSPHSSSACGRGPSAVLSIRARARARFEVMLIINLLLLREWCDKMAASMAGTFENEVRR